MCLENSFNLPTPPSIFTVSGNISPLTILAMFPSAIMRPETDYPLVVKTSPSLLQKNKP